jgi:hypothetical protein
MEILTHYSGAGIVRPARDDLRRTWAGLCPLAGGEPDRSQFLLVLKPDLKAGSFGREGAFFGPERAAGLVEKLVYHGPEPGRIVEIAGLENRAFDARMGLQ